MLQQDWITILSSGYTLGETIIITTNNIFLGLFLMACFKTAQALSKHRGSFTMEQEFHGHNAYMTSHAIWAGQRARNLLQKTFEDFKNYF